MTQQRKVYSALQEAGQPMTLGQIARMAGLDAQRISSAVCKLRTYGYIKIVSEVGKGSHRIRHYWLTDKPYIPQPMGHP
jgi:DNA-binding transcriptional regulator GbsR (MarR family)